MHVVNILLTTCILFLCQFIKVYYFCSPNYFSKDSWLLCQKHTNLMQAMFFNHSNFLFWDARLTSVGSVLYLLVIGSSWKCSQTTTMVSVDGCSDIVGLGEAPCGVLSSFTVALVVKPQLIPTNSKNENDDCQHPHK